MKLKLSQNLCNYQNLLGHGSESQLLRTTLELLLISRMNVLKGGKLTKKLQINSYSGHLTLNQLEKQEDNRLILSKRTKFHRINISCLVYVILHQFIHNQKISQHNLYHGLDIILIGMDKFLNKILLILQIFLMNTG